MKIALYIILIIAVIAGVSSLVHLYKVSNRNKTEMAKYSNTVSLTANLGKTLVIYYSLTGRTKDIALQIQSFTNADIYEIKPKVKYTGSDLNWNKKDSRSTIECKNRSSRPELADKNANISKYDTILVGFPVWWYLAPNIILTFLESYDFTGKKVVVWGTSWSSGMGKTTEEITKIAKGANVVEGVIFNKDHRKTSDYQKFISSLKL